VIIDVLTQQRIALSSPDSWEDRNDAFYLERYLEEKKLTSLLAICFSSKRETFHHWKVFSNGIAGACLEFNKEKLLHAIFEIKEIRSNNVDYHLIKSIEKRKPEIDTWPFVKRKPFQDESEFRIIYENKTEDISVKYVPINLNVIQKITLSPWMPNSVAESVISVLKNIPKCERVKISRSSLLESARWCDAIKNKT
jgi:hypothetical protein